MALLPDNGNIYRLLRDMRSMLAQHDTDIKRLWRLTRRDVNEPNEVIGGDAEDNTGGPGSVESSVEIETTPPPPNNGGGGAFGDPVDPDCCRWQWMGSSLGWVKIIDNTTGCTCPEPGSPGDYLMQTMDTCCESSSTSDDCVVVYWHCDLPCVIDVEIDATDPGDGSCVGYIGNYTLTWDEGEEAYIDDTCHPYTYLGFPFSFKIRATLSEDEPARFIISTTVWANGECSGMSSGSGMGGDAGISDCAPLLAEGGASTNPCIGFMDFTVTEG